MNDLAWASPAAIAALTVHQLYCLGLKRPPGSAEPIVVTSAAAYAAFLASEAEAAESAESEEGVG